MTSKHDEKGKFNFIGKMKTGYLISGIAILLSIGALFTMGLNYGIDFKGGSIFHYHFDNDLTEDSVRTLINKSALKAEFGEVVVQRVLAQADLGLVKEDLKLEKESTGCEFIIHTEASKEVIEAEDVEPKLEALFRSAALGSFEKYKREFIGPTVGASLRSKAILALAIAILGILLYISLRFEFVHAVAAVCALLHDSVIVMGIFAILQKEVNLGIMAALLTIIGYSLNDSIVILDRIRENTRLKGRLAYDQRVNLSLNQSLTRTINTSVTTLLAVTSLLFLGGVVIHDFALAMTIGVFVGTYSSMFVVSPILVSWYYKEHEKAARVMAEVE